MTDLEQKLQELRQIQNRMEVERNPETFMRLAKKRQKILDWLDEIWEEYEELRKLISEEEWEEFNRRQDFNAEG